MDSFVQEEHDIEETENDIKLNGMEDDETEESNGQVELE